MSQIIGLMIPSLGAFILIRDLANSILRFNLKKKYILFRSQSNRIDIIFLKKYYMISKKYSKPMLYCCIINYIYILLFVLFIALIVIHVLFVSMRYYILCIMILKGIILDSQVLIFVLLYTKHLKNGGVTWNLDK